MSQDLESEVRLAPVVVDGETLFSVRGVTAHPAERRAAEIADRIRVLAESKFDPRSITLEDRPGATVILADGRLVMAVLDEDASIEQFARRPLAEAHERRIQHALAAYRHDRRPGFLIYHTGYALVAISGLLLAAYVSRRIVSFLRARVERRYRTQVEDFQELAFQIVKADQIWRALSGLLNLAWLVALVIMVYACVHYILALFPWTRAFANHLLALAMDPLRTLGAGLVGVIPNLIFVAVLILVIHYGLKLTRLFFESVAKGAMTIGGFDAEWAMPTYRLVRLLAIALGAVVAYPYLPGSGSDAFKGISLFIGLIFSLGSSSLIGNVIAGYSMVYRRTFKVGDRVKIGQLTGDVERMRVLVTHLRTIKNEELIVPNSTILNTEVINFSSIARERGLILHATVGIGYETPWRQVEAMLVEAATRTPGVRLQPEPFVLQTLLGDFCVNYEINVYCDTPQVMEIIYADLHRNILDVFNEYNVQIMTPSYRFDPPEPKVVPRDQWYAAPAKPPTTTQSVVQG
jgi:small-conductance mechanosensitive channel